MSILGLLLLLSSATSQLPSGAPWPMFGGFPQHTRLSPFLGPQSPPAVLPAAFPATFGGPSEPVVAPDGSIVMCSGDASIRRFDAGGQELWRYSSSPSWCLGTPLLARGLVVAAFVVHVTNAYGPTALVVALDFASGRVVWELDPPGGAGATCWSSPIVTPEGVLIVACCNGDAESNILGVNSDTGAQLWGLLGISSCIKSSPSLSGVGQATFASVSGEVLVLLADTGALLLAASFPNHTFISSPTLTEDGELYIGYSLSAGSGGGLLALDIGLRQRWDLPLPSPVRSSPALSPVTGLVYINSDCAAQDFPACTWPSFFAVDGQGTLQWSARTGGGYASPLLDRGQRLVYGASDNGTVFALDQATGSMVWATSLSDGQKRAQSPVPVAPGKLLVTLSSYIVPAVIQVTSAWWGLNCANVSLAGANVTSFAAATCSGVPDSCYLTTAGLPDPALNCHKDLSVNFICNGSARFAYLPASTKGGEDWSWYLFLTCREPSGLVLLGTSPTPAGTATPTPTGEPPLPPPIAPAWVAWVALGLSAAILAGLLGGAGVWLWCLRSRLRSDGGSVAAMLLGGEGDSAAEFRALLSENYRGGLN
jgi:outer membrane protein assembly factor BamB